jgi:peptidoglycan/LPS O-acetylase OafA/YrhL
MTTQVEHTTKGNRIHWMDNLRTIAIFLVVLYHASGVYSLTFQSFWLVADPATSDVAGILNVALDVTAIPIIFFISGFLVPTSLKDKTAWAFVWSKFKRLMIPWLIAVLTLIPLYKVIFLASRGLPQEHWTTYFHFGAGNLTSQNWLWFLPLLFAFNVAYLLLSMVKIRLPSISFKWAVFGATAIGFVYSVGVGMLVGFRHWTKTPLIDFETEKLLPYFLVFALGALSFHNRMFEVKPKKQVMYIVVSSIAWMPITLHIMSRVIWVLSMGTLGGMVSPFIDRLIWWLGFDLSVLCMVYLMVQSFWRYLDRTGPIWDELNRDSYGVYIIHVIVIGGIALALLGVTLPGMLKWLILTVSAYVACNVLVSLYRRAVTGIRAAVGSAN